MNARDRRELEMANRTLKFAVANAGTSPGDAVAIARLKTLVARCDELAGLQLAGRSQVRAATERKSVLRRTMKKAHLVHVATAAKLAAREDPELVELLVMNPQSSTYQAFRTSSRGIAAEAQGRRELLVKHGLVESVLDDLVEALDQFDAAVESGAQGRNTHVAASAELRALTKEIVQVVKVMDGHNRIRFVNNPELLAAWESASNIQATPRGGTPDTAPEGGPHAGGEERPAA